MAYNASVQAKWDWDNAVAYAVEEALEKERAKTAKLLQEERAKVEEERVKAEEERTKAEAEKLATARSIKELGVLTNQQLAEKFNLPLDVVEGL